MEKLSYIPSLSTSCFTYNKESRTFSVFASDGEIRNFRPTRIYADSIDIGFYLVSEKTGQKILFVESKPIYGHDGEFAAWEYSANCLYENPESLLDLKVIIFND